MGEGGPDAAAPSEPVRVRLLTPEQLAKILEAHQYWVQSQGTQGKRADLVGDNLRQAKLQGADLVEADLRGTNLRGARGLSHSRLSPAKYWELAFYAGDLLDRLGLPPEHNQSVRKRLAGFRE